MGMLSLHNLGMVQQGAGDLEAALASFEAGWAGWPHPHRREPVP